MISELEKINYYVKEVEDYFLSLDDIIDAINNLSHEKGRDVTAEEVITHLGDYFVGT